MAVDTIFLTILYQRLLEPYKIRTHSQISNYDDLILVKKGDPVHFIVPSLRVVGPLPKLPKKKKNLTNKK